GGALLHAIGDAALGQVVGRHFDLDAVTGQDADVVLAHAPGDVRDDLVPVLELHTEHRVGKRLGDRAFEFNDIVFRHAECTDQSEGRAEARKTAIVAWTGTRCKIPVKPAPRAGPAGGRPGPPREGRLPCPRPRRVPAAPPAV